jgi:hypothetical protein
LGLPILAWTFLAAREWMPAWALRLSVLFVALCLWQLAFQLRDGAFFINHVSQKRIVAKYLTDNFQSSSRLKIFCDDDTVKVLAGIPADNFMSSSGSPGDSKSFLGYLKENRVEYLVYERRDRSAVVTLFRDLGEERINELFQLVASTNVDLRLYRTVFQ